MKILQFMIMKNKLRYLLLLLPAVWLAGCKQDAPAVIDPLLQGVWTNCPEYTDTTTQGIMMVVAEQDTYFATFDFKKGLLSDPVAKPLSECRLSEDGLAECMAEGWTSPHRFAYIGISYDGWWNSTGYPEDIDEYTGSFFNNSNGMLNGWSRWDWGGVVGDILAISASAMTIAGEAITIKQLKAARDTLLKALDVCKEIQKDLKGLDATVMKMCDKLDSIFNSIDKQITDQTLRLRLYTKRQRLQGYILILNQQQQRSVFLRNDDFAEKSYNEVQELYKTIIDSSGGAQQEEQLKKMMAEYVDKHYGDLYTWMGTDNARYTALMSYMDWVRSSTDGVCNYDVLQVVDNIAREQAAWEHETYPMRSATYLNEMNKVTYTGMIMLTFLSGCELTHRATPNPYADPAELKKRLSNKIVEYIAFIEKHNEALKRRERICLIDGMHCVVDSIIYKADYTVSRSWIKEKCSADQLIYGLDNKIDPGVMRYRQFSVEEIDAFERFYSCKGNFINSVLVEHGKLQYESAQRPSNPYLLLNGEVKKTPSNKQYDVTCTAICTPVAATKPDRYLLNMGKLSWTNNTFTGWTNEAKSCYRLNIYR